MMDKSMVLLQETVPYLRTLQEQYPAQPSIASLIGRIEAEIAREEEAERFAREWGKSFVTFSFKTTEDWMRQMTEAFSQEYAARGNING